MIIRIKNNVKYIFTRFTFIILLDGTYYGVNKIQNERCLYLVLLVACIITALIQGYRNDIYGLMVREQQIRHRVI